MKWLKDFTDALLHLFSFETGYCVISSKTIKLILLASINSSKRPNADEVCFGLCKIILLGYLLKPACQIIFLKK